MVSELGIYPAQLLSGLAQYQSYIHGIKLNNMNKKEIKSAINKAAYAFAESMGYEVHDDEGDGTVSFVPHEYTTIDDTITWHRSSHDTCVLNWSSDKTKADADAIDAHMKPIIEQYSDQYTPKRATA
jgi:DNA-binding helix-hairpin-helix protein with protein kinase domain